MMRKKQKAMESQDRFHAKFTRSHVLEEISRKVLFPEKVAHSNALLAQVNWA